VRNQFIDRVVEAESDALLTTGEAAKILGVSRQHIVDLADRGDLPVTMVGSHRRIRRTDLDKSTGRTGRGTRDQLRSQWIGIAVAGALAKDPGPLLERARGRVQQSLSKARVNRWDREWKVLLDGPIEQVFDALTSNTVRSRELRQNSPFSSALSQSDRESVLKAFIEAHPGRDG
jgi:excisionase family DNA binding protein